MTTALPKLEKLKPNNNWAKLPLFNRKNWSRVRFDDVVENVNEVTRERAQSFLTDDHIERIVHAYEKFADFLGFARVVTQAEVRAKAGNLSIPLYVTPEANIGTNSNRVMLDKPQLTNAFTDWLESSKHVRANIEALIKNSK